MAYVENPNLYIYVPKLYHIGLFNRLIKSKLNFNLEGVNLDLRLPTASAYFKVSVAKHSYMGPKVIDLIKVPVEKVPDDAYLLKVTQIDNYRTVLKMQGLDIELPEK